MAEIQLGVVEARYADIIWEHEPVSSSELVKLTEEAFHWKRTTAHNVLRRLCDKGLFRNDNGTVTSLISRDEFYAMQSRQFVEDTFEVIACVPCRIYERSCADRGRSCEDP